MQLQRVGHQVGNLQQHGERDDGHAHLRGHAAAPGVNEASTMHLVDAPQQVQKRRQRQREQRAGQRDVEDGNRARARHEEVAGQAVLRDVKGHTRC